MKINQNRLMLEMARQCITVNELCKKAGVSYPSMAKINAGKQNPKPATVGKLANALGVDVTELLDAEDGT